MNCLFGDRLIGYLSILNRLIVSIEITEHLHLIFVVMVVVVALRSLCLQIKLSVFIYFVFNT